MQLFERGQAPPPELAVVRDFAELLRDIVTINRRVADIAERLAASVAPVHIGVDLASGPDKTVIHTIETGGHQDGALSSLSITAASKDRSPARGPLDSGSGEARAAPSKPRPQPVTHPAEGGSAQDRGEPSQGGDCEAQKAGSCTSPSDGCAAAQLIERDPHNLSCSPEPPGLESKVSGEQTASKPSKRERVLDLWSQTRLSVSEIARQVGCPAGSVSAWLSMARAANDPRGFARRPVTGISQPAPMPKEMPPEPGVDLAPDRVPGVQFDVIAHDAKGPLFSLDTKALVLSGPLGDSHEPRVVIDTLAYMKGGELFDRATLIERGRWGNPGYFALHVPQMAKRLAAIGLEWVTVGKDMFRVRRLEQ